MKTKCILIVTMVTIMTLFTGCGENIVKSIENESTSSDTGNYDIGYDVQSLQANIPYTVKDVRESLGGNNVRKYFYVTALLEDETGNRVSVSYRTVDSKDSNYYNLSLLSENDTVTYNDGCEFVRTQEED